LSPALLAWALAVLLFWGGILLDRPRRWPGRLALRPGSADVDDGGQCDDVAVAIPARDEADVLERSLASLLAQGDDFAHLVLVDDRSGDGTGDVARRLIEDAAPRGRAEVLEGTSTPDGWSGKIWALQRAVEHILAGPEVKRVRWILFTDADIEHPPGSIRALRRLARDEGRDLVSVMARLRAVTFWECLLIPAFVWFFQLMFPFRRVRKDHSRVAAAAGGCVLVSRKMLEAIGGLDSIRGAVIDDVNLARRVKTRGGRLWLGLCSSMVSIRGYERLGQILTMVSRTAFDQLRYSYALLVLTLLALLVLFVSPPFLCVVAAVKDEPLVGLAASVAWAIQTWLVLPAVRHHGVAPRYALLLPVASVFYMWMTVLSAWSHFRGRGPLWKGREIGLGDSGAD